jgi:23S rRNA pseudouridine1911/1915/1917 synthase
VVTAHLAVEIGRRPFVRLIHRLDRLTSGVLLFALDPSVTAPLAQIWARGEVERRYTARVTGSFAGQRRVDLPLGKVEGEWRFQVDPAGLPAITEVEARETGDHHSLVRCRLLTGRTHQVRVHLAAIGHPVVGDLLYGGPPAARVMLHAESLELPHPRDHRPLRIVALRPEAFES